MKSSRSCKTEKRGQKIDIHNKPTENGFFKTYVKKSRWCTALTTTGNPLQGKREATTRKRFQILKLIFARFMSKALNTDDTGITSVIKMTS